MKISPKSSHTIEFVVADATNHVGGSGLIIDNIVFVPQPVGGVWTPANKLDLLAPWISLVVAFVSAVAVSSATIKRWKTKQT